MNSLVTGGGGFIGGYLIDRLLCEGHTVTVVERYTPEKKLRLQALGAPPHLSIQWLDIAQGSQKLQEKLHHAFSGVDWVFHLAGKGGIASSLQDPLAYHCAHVTGTVQTLEAARTAGVKKYIFLGTTSWYVADRLPITEQSPVNIVHPYGLVKYVAEQYITHWHQVFRLPTIILRPFSVYGPAWYPDGSYGSGITTLVNHDALGTVPDQVADSQRGRDFVFVTDIVDACMRAVHCSFQGEVFHLGTGKMQTLGGNGASVSAALPADMTKARTRLGWRARVSFAQGMQVVREAHAFWSHDTRRGNKPEADRIREWMLSMRANYSKKMYS